MMAAIRRVPLWLLPLTCALASASRAEEAPAGQAPAGPAPDAPAQVSPEQEGDERPGLYVSPGTVSARAGRSNAITRRLLVGNRGKGTLRWSLREAPSWAMVSPASGTLEPREFGSVELLIVTSDLAFGVLRGELVMGCSGPEEVVTVGMDIDVPPMSIRHVQERILTHLGARDRSGRGPFFRTSAGAGVEGSVWSGGFLEFTAAWARGPTEYGCGFRGDRFVRRAGYKDPIVSWHADLNVEALEILGFCSLVAHDLSRTAGASVDLGVSVFLLGQSSFEGYDYTVLPAQRFDYTETDQVGLAAFFQASAWWRFLKADFRFHPAMPDFGDYVHPDFPGDWKNATPSYTVSLSFYVDW